MILVNMMSQVLRNRLYGARYRERNKTRYLSLARKWRLSNIEKARESRNKWSRENPKKVSFHKRNWTFGKGAGAHFESQVAQQNNRCGICDELFSKPANLDHDHLTGKLRGALCTRCNRALGHYEKLRTGIDSYLKKWSNL